MNAIERPTVSAAWRNVFIVTSIAALVWVLAARMLGPSDIWDQTQPKTVSYTTDIVVHGNWILPIERGEAPATKPPLYNWFAAPFVKLLGFNSDLGHKMPSVLSLIILWFVIVRLGNALDPDARVLGWIAGTAVVANYTMFKLGYLARPDMVLTLWLVLGWMAATHVLRRSADHMQSSSLRAFAFWLCVGLAALTKGPAALVLIVYALVEARLLTGRFKSFNRLKWWWGLPLALAMIGAWVFAVWRINPEHLREELWFNEIYGRVTGAGPEGNRDGPAGFLKSLLHMPLYFLARFGPWSVPALLMMIVLWRRDGAVRRWQNLSRPAGEWMHASAVFVIVIVALFSLSTGKRADYIAASFAPGALLAGYWLLHIAPRIAMRLPWIVPTAAGIALAAMSVTNVLRPNLPIPANWDEAEQFINRTLPRIGDEHLAVAFWGTGETHLQAYLGYSTRAGGGAVIELIEKGEPFWVIAGRNESMQQDFEAWLASTGRPAAIAAVDRTPVIDGANALGWPQQMTLWRVDTDPPRQDG